MILKKKHKALILISLLLFFSGNPLAPYLFGKFSGTVGLLLTILIIHRKFEIEKDFIKRYRYILVLIAVIFGLQFILLPTISELAIINLLLKILMGGLIFNYLKESFVFNFFLVLSGLSLISLFFFIFINVFGLTLIPYILLRPEVKSYIFYGTSYAIHLKKNAGMFWEPGANAGILTLCLALNFKNLKLYWDKYRFKLIIILLTLISTQSTTGYIVGFAIALLYFMQQQNYIFSVIFLSALLSLGIFIYQKTDFLKGKIESQLQNASEQNIGEFSNSRFGSIIFDWHYIKKHPIIGNGFDIKTRYEDHQYMFIGAKGDVIGSGNGFSNYLAAMGIFFIIAYFYFLYKAIALYGRWFSFFILFVVLLNLQGEQWFNYPLYLGLPFIIYFKKQINKSQIPKYPISRYV